MLSMHEGKKLLRCSICKTCFLISSSNLKKHMISVLGMDNLLDYKSDEIQKMNLIHTVESSQNCDQCKKKFQNKRELKVHILSVHERKKLYRCSICNFQSQTGQGMKRHIVFDHEKQNLLTCKPKRTSKNESFSSNRKFTNL